MIRAANIQAKPSIRSVRSSPKVGSHSIPGPDHAARRHDRIERDDDPEPRDRDHSRQPGLGVPHAGRRGRHQQAARERAAPAGSAGGRPGSSRRPRAPRPAAAARARRRIVPVKAGRRPDHRHRDWHVWRCTSTRAPTPCPGSASPPRRRAATSAVRAARRRPCRAPRTARLAAIRTVPPRPLGTVPRHPLPKIAGLRSAMARRVNLLLHRRFCSYGKTTEKLRETYSDRRRLTPQFQSLAAARFADAGHASRVRIHSTSGAGTNRHLRSGPAMTFR